MLTFNHNFFWLKIFLFLPQKSPKKFTFKPRLHNPKLNVNFYSHNTPFLTTFITQKSITGINIWFWLILDTFMWFCTLWYSFKFLIKLPLFRNLKNINLKPIVKHMITLHIPKLSYIYIFNFFFTAYKSEWKERKFQWQKNLKKWLLQKQKRSQDRRYWC